MQYVSSGAYVFHSEVSQGISYVLTAGHSCESKFPKSQVIEGFRVENKGSKFKTVDLNGFRHDAAEWSIDEEDIRFVAFSAKRDIHAGEEILHDYGQDYWTTREDED